MSDRPAAAEIRALRHRANALKARLIVGKAGLNDAIVAQVRQALNKTDLLKVRIHADRDEAERIGAELAQRVPCVLVSRTGFVVTLYRPADSA